MRTARFQLIGKTTPARINMWTLIVISLAVGALVSYLIKVSLTRIISNADRGLSAVNKGWEYEKMKHLVKSKGLSLPAMFVDQDAFQDNVRHVLDLVRGSGKTLRVATKSIRCPTLIKKIVDMGQGVAKGCMCYSVEEAAFLAKYELDDFYIPYPTLQETDVRRAWKMKEEGKIITLTVDCVEHVTKIDAICGKCCVGTSGGDVGSLYERRLGVAIDLDLSYKVLGGRIHLGAHRAKVDDVRKFEKVVHAVLSSCHLRLAGAMGYEAHVAGLPDKNPFSPLPNFLIRLMKKLFYKSASEFRQEISEYCKKKEIRLDFFNGGGSGNLADACADPAITEVTAGSAFLQAQLFDYYVNNKCRPAFCFALQATRINRDYICCQSGGFIASGSCSQDKQPVPFANPLLLQPYADEGFGEVQTPLKVGGKAADVSGTVALGDPVFFRPAKSGEIAEHFSKYHLKRGYDIEQTVKTYRGLGQLFY